MSEIQPYRYHTHYHAAPLFRPENPACRGKDVGMFFSGEEGAQTVAKRICEGCDDRWECLQHGMKWEEEGVWGGMTAKERRRAKRKVARGLRG